MLWDSAKEYKKIMKLRTFNHAVVYIMSADDIEVSNTKYVLIITVNCFWHTKFMIIFVGVSFTKTYYFVFLTLIFF